MHLPTDRITHTTAFVTLAVEHWLERDMSRLECVEERILKQILFYPLNIVIYP